MFLCVYILKTTESAFGVIKILKFISFFLFSPSNAAFFTLFQHFFALHNFIEQTGRRAVFAECRKRLRQPPDSQQVARPIVSPSKTYCFAFQKRHFQKAKQKVLESVSFHCANSDMQAVRKAVRNKAVTENMPQDITPKTAAHYLLDEIKKKRTLFQPIMLALTKIYLSLQTANSSFTLHSDSPINRNSF